MARDKPKADYRVLFDYADGAEARLAQDRRHDYYQRVLPEMLKRLYGVPLAYDTYSKRWTPDSGKAPFWFRRNVTSPTGEKIPLKLNDAQDVVDFMTRQGHYKGQNGFNRGFGYLAPVFHQTRDQSPYLFVDLDVERPQFRGKSWRQLVKTTQRVHQWLELQGFETLIVFTGSSFHLWARKASETWSYEEAKEVLTRMSQDLDIPLSEGKSHRRGQVTVDYARNMYLGPIRFPLSLHGTSGLSSVVVPVDRLAKFKPLKQAQPDWVLEHLPEQLALLDQWFEKERDFGAESTTSAAEIIQQHLNTLDESDIERCIWGECGILADQLMALLQAAGYREAVYEIGRAYIHPFEEYDDKTYIGGHVVVTVDGESYDALGAGAKERWVEGPVVQEILAENGFADLGPLLSAHLTVSWITSTWDEVMETRRHLFSGREVSFSKEAESVRICERCGGSRERSGIDIRQVQDLDQSLLVSLNLPRNPTLTCPLCLTYFAKGSLGYLCDDCDLHRKQEHEVHRLMVELVEQAPKLDEYGDGVVTVMLEIPTNSAGDFYQEIDLFEEVSWTDLILELPSNYYVNERYFIAHVIETLERAQTETRVWWPSWWASDGNTYEALKRWKKRRRSFIHLDRAEWAYFAPQAYPVPAEAEGSDGFPRHLSFTASDWNGGRGGDFDTPLPVIVVSWPSTEYPDLKSRMVIAPFVPAPTYEAETVMKTKRAEISDDGYCSECGEHWMDIGKHPAIDGYEWSKESVRKALDRDSPEECWNCYAEFENINEEDEEEFDYYTDMLMKDVVDAQTVKKYIESIHDGYFAWWSDLDNLEFKLQEVPLSVWEDMERSEFDGQWLDAPVYSHRLSDTLLKFRNSDDYPPVVLALNKSGNYDVIDGFHRLNALQILERESVMAWVGTPVVNKKTKKAEEEDDGKVIFRSKYDKVLNDYLTYNPYTDREEWLEDIQWLIKHDDEEFFYTLKNLGKTEGKNLDSITRSEYLAMWASPQDPLIREAADIMIDKMLNHVDDLLDRAEYRDGKILLYREITLEDVAHYDTTKLGVYWTPNIMAAQAHWGYGARSNNPYLIRAWVSFDDIDWNATWRANLHLPDECEFQLKSQVAVEVLPLTKRMSGNFVKRHPQTGLPIVSLDVLGPAVEPETLVYEVDSPIKDLLAVSEAGQFELIEALRDLPPELQRLTGILELEDQPTQTGFASEENEESFYYHSTDVDNLDSIWYDGLWASDIDDSPYWQRELANISPHPYYYDEEDYTLPSVFVASTPEEAIEWAKNAGIENIAVIIVKSDIENLRHFSYDGYGGYRVAEDIPPNYILDYFLVEGDKPFSWSQGPKRGEDYFDAEQIFDYVPPQETIEWGFLPSSNRTAHPEGYVAQRYKNWSAPITGDLLDSFLENSLYHGTTEKAWELTQRKGYFTPREPFESGAKTGKQSLEGKGLMRQIGTYVSPVAGHAWQYATGEWGPGSSKDRPIGGAALVLKINPDEVRDLPWFIDLRDRAPSFFTTGRIPVEAVERVIEIPAEGPERTLTDEPFSWYEHPMMPLINEGFGDPNSGYLSYLKDNPRALEALRFWHEAIFEPGFLDQQSFEEKQRRVETFTGRPYETVEPCSCPTDKSYASSDELGKVWVTHPRKYGRTVPKGEHRVQLQPSYPGMDQEQKFQQEWWKEFDRQLEDFYISQMGLTPAEFRLLMQEAEDDESVAAFIRSENMGEPYDFNLWTRWWPKPRTPDEVARPYQDHTLEELMEGYRTEVGDWQRLRREKKIRYTQLLSRLEWASESIDRTVGEAWNDAKKEWEEMVEWSFNHNYNAKALSPLDVTAEEFEQALQYWNRITRVAQWVGESGTVLNLWNEEDWNQGWSYYVEGETLLRLVEDENKARFEEDVFEQYRQTGYINLAFYYFVLQVVLDLQWWLEDAWRGHGIPSRLATLDELLQPQSDATSVTAYRWVMAKRPQLQLSGGRSTPYGARKGARGWSYGGSWSLDPKAFTRTDVWEGSWEGAGRLDQYLEKQIPVNDIDWLGTLISCTLFRDSPEYEIIPAPGTFLAEEGGREEVVEYPVRLYHGTSLAAWEAIQAEGEMRAWSCFASDYGYSINMPETYIDLAIGGVPDTDEDRLRQGVVLELVFETEEEANQYLAPDMTMYDLGMAYLEDDLYEKYGLESGISSPWEWFQERFPSLVRQNKDTSKLPRLPSSDEDWQSSYLSVYAVALKRPVPASRLRRVE